MIIKDFSTGIDIEKIERFEKYSKDKNCDFVTRIFTEQEIEYCFKYNKPAEHLAVRFCAKEAVYKALSALGIDFPEFKNIEILNDEKGIPSVKLLNTEYPNIIIKISLSHSKDYATASVFIIKTK